MNEYLFLLLNGHDVRMWLLGLFISLQVLDAVTTKMALSVPGTREANPIVSWILTKFGFPGFYVVKAIVIAILLVSGMRVDNWLLILLNVGMLWVVVNNYKLYRNNK